MISLNVMLFWMVLINLASLALFAWAYRQLPASKEKRAFLIFVVSYLFWLNPLLCIHIIDPTGFFVKYIGKAILVGGCVATAAVGYFLVCFANPTELRSFRFKFIQTNFILVSILTLLGFMEQGIRQTEYGIGPISGVLMPYFDLSMCVAVVYFLTVFALGYRNRSEEPLAKVQLKTIFWTCLPGLGIALLTNAIVPALTQSFILTPTGGLWIWFFFFGIIQILILGDAILVKDYFHEFAESALRQQKLELRDLVKIIDFLPLVTSSIPGKENSSICFSKSKDNVFELGLRQVDPLSLEEQGCDVLRNDLCQALHHQEILQKQNRELITRLMRIQGAFGSDSSRRSSSDFIDLFDDDLFSEKISKHFGELPGGSVLYNSPCLMDSLNGFDKVQNISGLVLLEGEAGTGKSSLADLIHGRRGGEGLVEVYASSYSRQELLNETAGFFRNRALGSSKGIILKHFDCFSEDEVDVFYNFFNDQMLIDDLLYLTVTPGFFERLASLPKEIENRLRANYFFLSPLRERKTDIYYQVLSMLRFFSLEYGLGLEKVSRSALEELVSFPWYGNSRELRGLVELSAIQSDEGRVEEFILSSINHDQKINSLMNCRTIFPGLDSKPLCG